jgi:hypothetical protein
MKTETLLMLGLGGAILYFLFFQNKGTAPETSGGGGSYSSINIPSKDQGGGIGQSQFTNDGNRYVQYTYGNRVTVFKNPVQTRNPRAALSSYPRIVGQAYTANRVAQAGLAVSATPANKARFYVSELILRHYGV